jgi:hypothetical protein
MARKKNRGDGPGFESKPFQCETRRAISHVAVNDFRLDREQIHDARRQESVMSPGGWIGRGPKTASKSGKQASLGEAGHCAPSHDKWDARKSAFGRLGGFPPVP